MQWLVAEGFTRFIELGPGNVLSGLMKRINRDVEMISVSDVRLTGIGQLLGEFFENLGNHFDSYGIRGTLED